MVTDAGEIAMDLYVCAAPRSAGAFLQYAREGHLRGACFVRVVRPDNDHGSPPIAVIQAQPAESNAPEQMIEHESTDRTGIVHVDGTVSLGRREPGTASPGHFFICVGDHPGLDLGGSRCVDRLGFAAFARVTRGMDTVRRIHRQPTVAEALDPYLRGQLLATPVSIRSVHCEGLPDPNESP